MDLISLGLSLILLGIVLRTQRGAKESRAELRSLRQDVRDLEAVIKNNKEK